MSQELINITLRSRDEVAGLRHLTNRAARLLGLGDSDAIRVATSVSELGRLAQGQLPIGFIMSCRQATAVEPAALEITIACSRLPAEVAASGTVGAALHRLMDTVLVGTSGVSVAKLLPAGVSDELLARVREQLDLTPRSDLREALERQNEELLSVLLTLREREAELVGLNEELAETNRGVVALYAQLDQSATEVRDAQRIVFEELEAALRPRAPVVPGLELDVRYVPAQSNSPTGGDLYDWFVLADGRLHVTVVDVQGHGVASSRDALLVTHAVRTLVLEGHPLGEVFARANAILQGSTSSVVATAILAQLDPRSGAVLLAGAGHPPALQAVSGEYVDADGRPIGYPHAGSEFVAPALLASGDTLLLYTDGLIEIRRDILEGLDTLAASARSAATLPLAGMLDTVLDVCARGHELVDDTLLLGIRFTGPPESDGPA